MLKTKKWLSCVGRVSRLERLRQRDVHTANYVDSEFRTQRNIHPQENTPSDVYKKTDGLQMGRLKFLVFYSVETTQSDRLADAKSLLCGLNDNSKACRIIDRHFG